MCFEKEERAQRTRSSSFFSFLFFSFLFFLSLSLSFFLVWSERLVTSITAREPGSSQKYAADSFSLPMNQEVKKFQKCAQEAVWLGLARLSFPYNHAQYTIV